MKEQIEQLKSDKAALEAAKEAMRKFEQRRDLTWTSNDRIWLALHGDQWAKIQRVNDHDYPLHAYIGDVIPCRMSDTRIDHGIDTDVWNIANKTFETLEDAQSWAAEKLGVEK